MPWFSNRPAFRELVIAAGLALAVASGISAQPKEPKVMPPKEPKATLPAPTPLAFPAPTVNGNGAVVTRYSLGEALAIGHEKHPTLAAMKASMNAALLKARGLGEVKRMAGFVTPDIEFREQQSDLGLKAAMAEYESAQHEVTYAVVRCYFTVVYAREQGKVAKELVEQLEANLDQVRKIVEGKGGGVKGISQDTVDRLEVIVGEARRTMNKATFGTVRAKAALREAMGLDPIYEVDVADEMLPEIRAEIKRDTVVAHAVTRRGEIMLTQMGVDVTRLEACAQWSRSFNLTAYTYAIAGDIHAKPVPAAQRDPDYKPGAIGPEMPARLVGRNGTRSDTAKQYALRSEASAVQARSIIGLEAAVSHSRWQEATENVRVAKPSANAGRKLIERQRLAAGGTLSKEDVLMNEVAATRAIASLNEALWEQIIELANLERITAGGVKVNFPGR